MFIPLNQDMDAQLRYLLVHVDKRTRTADHPTTAERPCSKVQSAIASTFLGTSARAHEF